MTGGTSIGGFSRTFGSLPRDGVRKHDYCSRSMLHRDYPRVASILSEYATQASKIYKAAFPESFAWQSEMIATNVRPEWRLGQSPFTSGIVNWNNPLQYHYDAGNFEGSWSVMAVFKRDVDGGHLILPDYNVKVELAHKSLFLFDGQSDLHGVTPILKRNALAHRYSVVYYALEAICRCGSPADELRRGQKSRTESEMKRAGLRP